ncbi:MAG TPA: malto-oligosyltrehalose trehalohydrolase [Afifellaceae bacterium]|nr:malto-oligosyltrehalose trehalohydrolase [Afifellaceae bacterium]
MTGRFAYSKSWGSELLDGGDARFRLWAPAQESVALRAEGGRDLPMSKSQDGWFAIETDAVPPDGGYRFVLADGTAVPDPVSRGQVDDVHGPSRLVDPRAYEWRTAGWTGRPWEEVVIYELHTGTFTEAGTFDGVVEKLDHIRDVGFTAVELMPVAHFGGRRGWGYDGVLPYAPHTAYGGPEGLKRLVDAAHARGLMILLDVVYNHFGPDGNYLHLYAPEFFHPERMTPWGGAIAYEKEPVRRFFIDNALYWLEEYRFDVLRFDAIDQIDDQSDEPILEELAREVRSRIADRHIHLTTEDDRNVTFLHERDAEGQPKLYSGEWNDDFHHVAHVAATGESEGYYADYIHDHPVKMARALATGFVQQGERSAFRDDTPRGEPSAHLPPTAFVNFLQNHDQIGNRAFGERLTDLAEAHAVEALTAILLLSPQIPLLYMGEEWGETRSFTYFTDFHGELGDAVREGRREEFRKWASFRDPGNRDRIPDPNAESTFLASRLDWSDLEQPSRQARLDLFRRLLELRRREIVPLLPKIGGHAGEQAVGEGGAFAVRWRLSDGRALALYANVDEEPWPMPRRPEGRLIYESAAGVADGLSGGTLPGWSVAVRLSEAPLSDWEAI